MKLLFCVGVGSFLGGTLRYLISLAIKTEFPSEFPLGTLIVNILGCLAIGALYALVVRNDLSPEWRVFLATGVCGGFTTFSAFGLETFGLLRTGHMNSAMLYIAFSVILGLVATWIGYRIFVSL